MELLWLCTVGRCGYYIVEEGKEELRRNLVETIAGFERKKMELLRFIADFLFYRNKKEFKGTRASFKMERGRVYEILDGEREYQNQMVAPGTHHLGKPSVAEELVMMEHYLAEARKSWVTTKGDEESLEMMRKVAGIAVRCFENHGCPVRKVKKMDLLVRNLEKEWARRQDANTNQIHAENEDAALKAAAAGYSAEPKRTTADYRVYDGEKRFN